MFFWVIPCTLMPIFGLFFSKNAIADKIFELFLWNFTWTNLHDNQRCMHSFSGIHKEILDEHVVKMAMFSPKKVKKVFFWRFFKGKTLQFFALIKDITSSTYYKIFNILLQQKGGLEWVWNGMFFKTHQKSAVSL